MTLDVIDGPPRIVGVFHPQAVFDARPPKHIETGRWSSALDWGDWLADTK